MLRGDLIGVECRGGVFGYTIDFPPHYFSDDDSYASDGMDTDMADAVVVVLRLAGG